jgi:hypothetical protein
VRVVPSRPNLNVIWYVAHHWSQRPGWGAHLFRNGVSKLGRDGMATKAEAMAWADAQIIHRNGRRKRRPTAWDRLGKNTDVL